MAMAFGESRRRWALIGRLLRQHRAAGNGSHLLAGSRRAESQPTAVADDKSTGTSGIVRAL